MADHYFAAAAHTNPEPGTYTAHACHMLLSEYLRASVLKGCQTRGVEGVCVCVCVCGRQLRLLILLWGWSQFPACDVMLDVAEQQGCST